MVNKILFSTLNQESKREFFFFFFALERVEEGKMKILGTYLRFLIRKCANERGFVRAVSYIVSIISVEQA